MELIGKGLPRYSNWLCYNAKFLKLCDEYNIVVDGNYCMRNVYLRFYHLSPSYGHTHTRLTAPCPGLPG